MLIVTFNYVCVIIGILGGMILINFGTIKNMPHSPAWSRIAVRIAGSCAIIWAILEIMRISHIVMFNIVANRFLHLSKAFLGGMVIGILLIVFISGNFNKKSKNQ